MRSFVASKKFAFITFLILVIGTTVAFALLQPTGADISNDEIVRYFSLAGWFTGLATALISALLLLIFTAIGKLLKICRFDIVHGIGAILSLLPWLIMSWQITAEPRYTNIGIAIIDFIARPMLWGSLLATLFALAFTLLTLFPKPKKKK